MAEVCAMERRTDSSQSSGTVACPGSGLARNPHHEVRVRPGQNLPLRESAVKRPTGAYAGGAAHSFPCIFERKSFMLNVRDVLTAARRQWSSAQLSPHTGEPRFSREPSVP